MFRLYLTPMSVIDYLFIAGATPLSKAASCYVAIPPSLFFQEDQRIFQQRPRSKAYNDLSDFWCPT